MAEEHMGKKRLREVRQAVNLKRESRRLLAFVVSASVAACAIIIALLCFSLGHAGGMKQLVGIAGSVIILLIAVILVVPKARRHHEVREALEEHRQRFNISDDDMLSLRQ